MKKHKWGCIVNPAAGKGYPEKHLKEITESIRKFQPETVIEVTKKPGHGIQIAHDFIHKGIDTIIVAGGDGTVHEVGSVLVDNPKVALGVISCGTGNDYNYMAGFPDRFQENDWAALFSRNVKAVDVGICNNEYFFNGMGIGFDAAMSAESQADRIRTGTSGKGRYTWIILKMLLGYKEGVRTVMDSGGTREEKAFMTTIAIGRRFAGIYHLTPKAIADDGLLDVCNILPLKLHKRLQILLKVPKGTHLQEKAVQYSTGTSFSYQFKTRVPAHLDGELIYDYEFKISIKEKALNLIINPGRAGVAKTTMSDILKEKPLQ